MLIYLTPLKGKKKSTGYPDLEFIDEFGRTNYLECKTYNKKNISTTQRSFYLSPSTEFKVTQDAHHFLLSYEVDPVGRKGNNNIYKCKNWKIVTLDQLSVDLKYEFNADNKRLYDDNYLLAEKKNSLKKWI